MLFSEWADNQLTAVINRRQAALDAVGVEGEVTGIWEEVGANLVIVTGLWAKATSAQAEAFVPLQTVWFGPFRRHLPGRWVRTSLRDIRNVRLAVQREEVKIPAAFAADPDDIPEWAKGVFVLCVNCGNGCVEVRRQAAGLVGYCTINGCPPFPMEG